MTLSAHDHAALEARWLTPELAERAGLYRVTSTDGAQLMGRNGSGDYNGIGSTMPTPISTPVTAGP